MYTLFFLKGAAPFIGAACLDNYLNRQGTFCNIRDYQAPVSRYYQPRPEDACYRDGIFYPRCKDLENPEVLHYHNLLKGEVK